MSPEVFLGQDAEKHLDHAERLFDGILGQGARLPSQRRFEARERSHVKGVSLPKALYDELQQLAAG